MFKNWLSILALMIAFLASGCLVGNEKQIAEVKAGHRQSAKASWWGFDRNDSTKCLQAAINSGVRKLVVENTGSDWIVGPLKVASNIEIIFRDGVVIRAKRGEFKGRSDCLFDIYGQTNVTLRGEGNVLFVMNKTDYQDPALYQPADHRHTVNIFGSQDVLIQNLTLRSSGGDGIYVGSNPVMPPARNITIDRVTCEDHHRQGISVTAADNLLLKDSQFNSTSGTEPQSGIDLEPNYPQCSIVNFVAENCEFSSNVTAGISVNIAMLDSTSKPITASFRNCRIQANKYGILMMRTFAGAFASPGRIEFDGCEVSGSRERSLSVGRCIAGNMDMVFRNVVVDNRNSKYEGLHISSDRPDFIRGLRIEGLKVIDDSARPPIKFESRFWNGLEGAVVKDVKTIRSDGSEIAFDGEKFLAASAPAPEGKAFKTLPLETRQLQPVAATGKVAGGNIRYRGTLDYLQYAHAGRNVGIKFGYHVASPSYKDHRAPVKVVVFNPAGVSIDKFDVPFEETVNYTLRAGESGVYRLAIDAGPQTVAVETAEPGQGFSAAGYLYVFGCRGRLYFLVPAGIKDIRIDASGSPREISTVHLLDQEGKDVAAGVNLEGSKILSHMRQDMSRDEIWSVKFEAQKLWLRIGSPLTPVFSSDPANLLKAFP